MSKTTMIKTSFFQTNPKRRNFFVTLSLLFLNVSYKFVMNNKKMIIYNNIYSVLRFLGSTLGSQDL